MADSGVPDMNPKPINVSKKDIPFIEKERVNRILLGHNSHLLEISTEESLNDSDENLLKKHNQSFVNLLNNYVVSSDKSQKHKRGMKIAFFVITMVIVIMLILSFVATIFAGLYMRSVKNISILELLAPLITSFASVITSIIILPKIIAEYLFDKSEDDRLSQIVSNMQNYDKELRNQRNIT